MSEIANSMSIADFKALHMNAPRSKYRNKKVVIDGENFDSIHEADCYFRLVALQKTGRIKDLRRQVKFELTGTNEKGEKRKVCAYYADFVYFDNEGPYMAPIGIIPRGLVVADAKGVETKEFKLKKKLMKANYDIDIVLM